MPLVIVETAFDPPTTDEEFDVLAERADPCLGERHARWITSYFAIDRRRRICVFDAPDAEAVRQAYRMANVKFEKIWSAEQILDEEEDQ
jgi:hypothetical protein